jgi:hypothetical protein
MATCRMMDPIKNTNCRSLTGCQALEPKAILDSVAVYVLVHVTE